MSVKLFCLCVCNLICAKNARFDLTISIIGEKRHTFGQNKIFKTTFVTKKYLVIWLKYKTHIYKTYSNQLRVVGCHFTSMVTHDTQLNDMHHLLYLDFWSTVKVMCCVPYNMAAIPNTRGKNIQLKIQNANDKRARITHNLSSRSCTHNGIHTIIASIR